MAGWMQAGSVVPARTPATPGSFLGGTPLAGSATGGKDASRRRPPPLSMYTELPHGEISIEEFERLALERLRVLKGLEDAKARGLRPDEVEERAAALVERHMWAPSPAEMARRDAISHHVLRLAYCRTEDLRRWFLGLETELFRLRFRSLLPSEQRAVAEAAALPYAALSRGEFSEVEQELRTAMVASGAPLPMVAAAFQGPASHESFYKAPFEAVPDLVATRRAYLRAGWAYVPREALSSLVLAPFRAQLSKALAVTARRWGTFLAASEGDRLAPVVEGLSRRYLGADYADPRVRGVGAARVEDLPALDRASFPLCMHNMYGALRRDHSLRHDGRMQLGLFLKGIGLPLDEAVRFWRQEMAPVCPSDKFDKEYLYNVRHNYGKEGNRKDYTPYTCAKIVASTPGTGQVHGCPYRTFSKEQLRATLGQLAVPSNAIEEAVSKASAGHYQLACAAVWEGKHGCSCETGINHPNQYFEESRASLGEQSQSTPAARTPGPRRDGAPASETRDLAATLESVPRSTPRDEPTSKMRRAE